MWFTIRSHQECWLNLGRRWGSPPWFYGQRQKMEWHSNSAPKPASTYESFGKLATCLNLLGVNSNSRRLNWKIHIDRHHWRGQKYFIELSKWWFSSKNLRLKIFFYLWSQVRALWLLIWWPLKAYMIVNFKARGISRGTRKLARTPTLNKKK